MLFTIMQRHKAKRVTPVEVVYSGSHVVHLTGRPRPQITMLHLHFFSSVNKTLTQRLNLN